MHCANDGQLLDLRNLNSKVYAKMSVSDLQYHLEPHVLGKHSTWPVTVTTRGGNPEAKCQIPAEAYQAENLVCSIIKAGLQLRRSARAAKGQQSTSKRSCERKLEA